MFYGISCKKYRHEFYRLFTRWFFVPNKSSKPQINNQNILITKKPSFLRLRKRNADVNIQREEEFKSSKRFVTFKQRYSLKNYLNESEKSRKQRQIQRECQSVKWCEMSIASDPCFKEKSSFHTKKRPTSLKSLQSLKCQYDDKNKPLKSCSFQSICLNK